MLQHGIGTLSGPVAADEERYVAAARNLTREKEEQKQEWDSSGHVAWRSSDR